MAASRRQFAMQQELNSTLNARLERRYRDEWIDSQHELNVVVGLVSEKDPSLRHIKIIQTFHGALDISLFLDALDGSEVQTVAFVGVNMDEEYSIKLAKAVFDLNSSIACLQLCRIVPTGLSNICPALSQSKSLKELRLTFNHDLPTEGIELLMESLGASQALEIFKLYCVDLHKGGTKMLANAVTKAKSLVDLRITSCNLKDITCLATAIKETNLTRVDLSMNRISDSEALATLWECPSITYLSFSQNEIGSEEIGEWNKEKFRRQFDCLASNKTLTNLHLDMNPLSPDFVEYLRIALQQNTTLMRLGLLSLTLPKEAFLLQQRRPLPPM